MVPKHFLVQSDSKSVFLFIKIVIVKQLAKKNVIMLHFIPVKTKPQKA